MLEMSAAVEFMNFFVFCWLFVIFTRKCSPGFSFNYLNVNLKFFLHFFFFVETLLCSSFTVQIMS